MISIPLTRGMTAVIDEEDFDLVNQYKWCAREYKNNFYAIAYVKGTGRENCKLIYMHRLIMGFPASKDVDHVDGNRLNNSKSNLRIASRSQNNMNSYKKRGSSKYKGVRFDSRKKKRKWSASGKFNGKNIWLGSYLTEIEAAKAYDAFAKEHYGQFANLNFKEAEDVS